MGEIRKISVRHDLGLSLSRTNTEKTHQCRSKVKVLLFFFSYWWYCSVAISSCGSNCHKQYYLSHMKRLRKSIVAEQFLDFVPTLCTLSQIHTCERLFDQKRSGTVFSRYDTLWLFYFRNSNYHFVGLVLSRFKTLKTIGWKNWKRIRNIHINLKSTLHLLSLAWCSFFIGIFLNTLFHLKL